ncbi:hypothetical protein [Mycoplasma bradburyae]|uniref:hypothetical protein n=1 Tax=Mycoplasma bradburyae TaxID=2963128 RepID=UPI0023403738|nr:hypothetical protein [Mycoplasma bradburyae]MDC4184400.1 hypothetical protein [Mycoplasma bradburyae]
MRKNKVKDPLKANYFKWDLVPRELKPSRKKSYIYLVLAVIALIASLILVALSAAPYEEILNKGVTQSGFIDSVSKGRIFTKIYTPENSGIEPGTVGLEITPLVNNTNYTQAELSDIRIAIGCVSLFLFVLFLIFVIVSYMYFLGSISIKKTEQTTVSLNKNL